MGLIDYIHEKRLEKERAERNEKIVGTLKVLAGIGAGFTLGVLFAPKSGKETRKNISDATKKGLNYVGEKLLLKNMMNLQMKLFQKRLKKLRKK